jgi:hypothetical protein
MAVAIGRDARPQARGSVRSQILEGAVLAPRCLKASRGTSPLRRFRPVPEYGVRRFRRACDVKRMAEAVSGLLPREDKAICHARAQSVGEPLGSAVGAGRFNADPQGFRLALSPSGPPTAAMTNARPLPGTRRCISPHVFAAVMARSGRLLSVLRLMAPSMPTHKDHEKDVGAEAAADATVEKRLMPTTGHGRRLSPQAAGVRRNSALTSNVVRLIARRGHVPGGSCGLRGSAARLSPSRS